MGVGIWVRKIENVFRVCFVWLWYFKVVLLQCIIASRGTITYLGVIAYLGVPTYLDVIAYLGSLFFCFMVRVCCLPRLYCGSSI